MNYFVSLAAATGAADPTQQAGGMSQLFVTVGSLLIFGLVMYFMIIRPQRKRDKELKEQMASMRVGDKVVTIGGIVGKVANIKDDEITISTSLANTLITFQKSAISTVVSNDAPKEKSVVEKKKKFKVKEDEE